MRNSVNTYYSSQVQLDRMELDETALIAALKRKLPLYMVPSVVVVRDEIPRSPNGKFDRALLSKELTS